MRLDATFYKQDVLTLAPALLGMSIVTSNKNKEDKYIITEVEAYRGEEDQACHASKGITSRTKIMYENGGYVYVYLIYGMYWMLNIVAGDKNNPQAALIRAVSGCSGPGRVGKLLGIDKSYYGENLLTSKRIWLEDHNDQKISYQVLPRVGIDYAGEFWKNKPWRFILENL